MTGELWEPFLIVFLMGGVAIFFALLEWATKEEEKGEKKDDCGREGN